MHGRYKVTVVSGKESLYAHPYNIFFSSVCSRYCREMFYSYYWSSMKCPSESFSAFSALGDPWPCLFFNGRHKAKHINITEPICMWQTLTTYKTQLAEDPIVNAHLKTLYDNLLEQNLCRIIEPFSKVQVQHVANLIKLPVVGTFLLSVGGWLYIHASVWTQSHAVEVSSQ